MKNEFVVVTRAHAPKVIYLIQESIKSCIHFAPVSTSLINDPLRVRVPVGARVCLVNLLINVLRCAVGAPTSSVRADATKSLNKSIKRAAGGRFLDTRISATAAAPPRTHFNLIGVNQAEQRNENVVSLEFTVCAV